jgi:hypothetical protein
MALMVTGPPAATPLTEKVPVVVPAAMVIVPDDTVAIAVFELFKVTTRADVGAGDTVTVPLIDRLMPTKDELVVTSIVFVVVMLNALLVVEVRPVALAPRV